MRGVGAGVAVHQVQCGLQHDAGLPIGVSVQAHPQHPQHLAVCPVAPSSARFHVRCREDAGEELHLGEVIGQIGKVQQRHQRGFAQVAAGGKAADATLMKVAATCHTRSARLIWLLRLPLVRSRTRLSVAQSVGGDS